MKNTILVILLALVSGLAFAEYKVMPNGDKKWLKDGVYHRVDGPALIKRDGTQKWFLNGKLHRVGGPALILSSGDQYWYLNDKLHRVGGPAVIKGFGGGQVKEWWKYDEYIKTEYNP